MIMYNIPELYRDAPSAPTPSRHVAHIIIGRVCALLNTVLRIELLFSFFDNQDAFQLCVGLC